MFCFFIFNFFFILNTLISSHLPSPSKPRPNWFVSLQLSRFPFAYDIYAVYNINLKWSDILGKNGSLTSERGKQM